MNPKSRVRVFHESREIEMNKVFAKMVQNPFSEEYAFLQKIRGDYPVYMKDYIIVDSTMSHVPEYYPYMYLDGYSPMEILQAAHRKIYADYQKRQQQQPELKITTEVKLK